jgi:hypothetical protein
LASSRTITLSWGAKKKERIEQRRVLSDEGLQVGDHVVVENHGNQWAHQAQIIDIDMDEGLQVGDDVIVENHGKYWPHKAQIIDIDMETNIATIRWKTTQKVDLVHLKDLKQFSLNNATPRKQKSTDFYAPSSGRKMTSTEQCQNYRSDLQCCTENMFYSEKNSSKLCAEGAIGNMMNVLHCPQNEVKQFWDIVQSPVNLILQRLGE